MAAIGECGSCRFWRGRDGIISTYGDCRRHPPTKSLSVETGSEWIKLGMRQQHPETYKAHWCGDFEKAEQ